MITVEITQVGFQTLAILARYMSGYIGNDAALKEAETLLDDTSACLSDNPEQFPVCHELASLGVNDYRQVTFAKYKVLFRYQADSNRVYITAFMRHRQSAQQLLVDYTLLL